MVTEFEKKQAEKEEQKAKETLDELVGLKHAFFEVFAKNNIKTFLVVFEREGVIHGINCLPKYQTKGSSFKTNVDGTSKSILSRMLIKDLKDYFGQ